MFTVTVNIASRGTPIADDGTGHPGVSQVGHMWYEMDDGQGNKFSYGFAPKEHGTPVGEGKPIFNDSTNYQSREYTRTIDITEAQYKAMKDFGEHPGRYGFDKTKYNGATNSCIDFTWKAMKKGGLNPNDFQGAVWPTYNIDPVTRAIAPDPDGFFSPNEARRFGLPRGYRPGSPSGSVGRSFGMAEDIRSPLIIDLNRDGVVETQPLANNNSFDHDGNQFAEQTGWVGPNDALVVWDRNGDGQINSGAELFGNYTNLLTNNNANINGLPIVLGLNSTQGYEQDNGLSALAELDSNHDNKIDAQDEHFKDLRYWQDKNSDGVVEGGELLTSAQAQISSLSTKKNAQPGGGWTGDSIVNFLGNTYYIDNNGQWHGQFGSVTRTDGTLSAMNDVWFTVDTLHTVDLDIIPVSDDIAALPDIEAFGNVHDLQQAMQRDPALVALVKQFIAEPDATVRHSLVSEMLYRWANVYAIDPISRATYYGNFIGDGRIIATLEAFIGQKFSGTWCWGTRDPNPNGKAAPILIIAFKQLLDYTYGQLMLQSQLVPLLNQLDLVFTNDTLSWDVSHIVTTLQNQYANDPDQALTTIEDLGSALRSIGTDGEALLTALQSAGAALTDAPILGVVLAQVGLNATNFNSISGTTVNGTEQNNLLVSLTGDDVLTSSGGNSVDTYLFNLGDGKDTIIKFDTFGYDNTIQFGAGITAGGITLIKNGVDLIFKISDTDQIFTGDSVDFTRLASIQFTDAAHTV